MFRRFQKHRAEEQALYLACGKLWEEYYSNCKKEGVTACSYITFTKNYKKYTADKNYTSRIEHKPGVEIEVDWSGPTMSYVNPDTGEIITAYLFIGEYYSVAILPTGVKKPNHKASVEGSVGKIATAIIARLRNETFTSLLHLAKNRSINAYFEVSGHID